MKLIRFGKIGEEKPGILLANKKKINVSGFGEDFRNFLVLKWSSCSLLWASYHWWVSWGREIALPLIFVDLVPRVGGLGAKTFFRNALD